MLLTLSPMDPKYAIYQKLVQATPAKAWWSKDDDDGWWWWKKTKTRWRRFKEP
jgi:hypothetical protein